MSEQDFSERLTTARERAGFSSPREAAQRFGWNENTYKSRENGQRKIPKDQEQIRTYARAFGVPFLWLLTGQGDPAAPKNNPNAVPVMGRIGAGAEIDANIEQVPPEGYYNVSSIIPLPPNSIAFEVVGDSMYPRYFAGDIIVCPRDGTPFDQLPEGAEAAVRAEDGRRYLKHVFKTGEPGHYNLMSHNAIPIQNIALEWAAHVLVTIRADQWSRLDEADRQKFIREVAPSVVPAKRTRRA